MARDSAPAAGSVSAHASPGAGPGWPIAVANSSRLRRSSASKPPGWSVTATRQPTHTWSARSGRAVSETSGVSDAPFPTSRETSAGPAVTTRSWRTATAMGEPPSVA